MGAFAPLAHIDCWELAASLRPRMALFRTDEDGARRLKLRWPQDPDADALAFRAHKDYAKWTELRNVLSRIQRKANATPFGPVELGQVFLEAIDPGVELPWSTLEGRYFERHLRFHVPLRTNPLSTVFAGCEGYHVTQWWITLVAHHDGAVPLRQSATNLGEHQRVHLICDLRKKEVPED